MASETEQRGVKAKEKSPRFFGTPGWRTATWRDEKKRQDYPKCCLSGAAVLISQCAMVSQRLKSHDAPLIAHRLASDCAAIYKTHFLQRFGNLTLFSPEVLCGLIRSIEIFALQAMIS
jgi:hypothetical protein